MPNKLTQGHVFTTVRMEEDNDKAALVYQDRQRKGQPFVPGSQPRLKRGQHRQVAVTLLRKSDAARRMADERIQIVSPDPDEIRRRDIAAFARRCQGGDAAREQELIDSIADRLLEQRQVVQIPMQCVADRLEIPVELVSIIEHHWGTSEEVLNVIDQWTALLNIDLSEQKQQLVQLVGASGVQPQRGIRE